MDSTAPIHVVVPDEPSRLMTSVPDAIDGSGIVEALRKDYAVLISGLTPERSERILHEVAERLGLVDRLKFQAAFAASVDRERIGKYGMTVNRRGDYQFIPPHSEGDSLINVQLASFYCLENSTDGGETVLMNVAQESDVWKSLREKVVRLAPRSKPPSTGELKQARALYRLRSPHNVLTEDRLLEERPTEIPGVTVVDVLTRPQKTRSVILALDLYAYWSSIANFDFDSLAAYVALLRHGKLLRQPVGGREPSQMDTVADKRVWSSGVDHNRIFKCKVIRKLASGDLVMFNNMTWVHAATNWTPGRGVRRVSAAFA